MIIRPLTTRDTHQKQQKAGQFVIIIIVLIPDFVLLMCYNSSEHINEIIDMSVYFIQGTIEELHSQNIKEVFQRIFASNSYGACLKYVGL